MESGVTISRSGYTHDGSGGGDMETKVVVETLNGYHNLVWIWWRYGIKGYGVGKRLKWFGVALAYVYNLELQ